MSETATGAFADPTLLPVVFPGVAEHVETHLDPPPGDERIVDLDFCPNVSAIYHLEPIEDLTVREWGEDGRLKGLTLLLGRFSRGAFAQRANRVPLLLRSSPKVLFWPLGGRTRSRVVRKVMTRRTTAMAPKTAIVVL